jgi:hypothetical protein
MKLDALMNIHVVSSQLYVVAVTATIPTLLPDLQAARRIRRQCHFYNSNVKCVEIFTAGATAVQAVLRQLF